MTGSLIEILRQGVVDAEARGNNGNRNRKRKKNNGKNNEAIQQQIQARCVSQIPACEALALESCGDDGACQIAVQACCQSLGTCEFTEFVACFNAALNADN